MPISKIVDLEKLKQKIKERSGAQVAFTNGCFDLLHVGHVRLLGQARARGDLLVVGLNSDSSVRGLKGPGRPLMPQDERAEVLAALECVDYVVIFDDPDPRRLVLEIRPQVLVKGADWGEGEIIGADEVHGWGGEVYRVELVEGTSTSALIERIQMMKE